MVNVGWNLATLLGLLYLGLALLYPSFIFPLVSRKPKASAHDQFFYLIQAIATPILLLLISLILIFNGWRLDPLLQFSQFLTGILIILFMAKDILVLISNR